MRSILAAAMLVSHAAVASPDVAGVLTAAAANYSARYAAQVEQLLAAMFELADEGAEPIEVRVDLLVARFAAASGGIDSLDSLENGATLRDGRGDPSGGDRLKVRFAANCACYVYLVGIDAGGRVTTIFPDEDSEATNPVKADHEYTLPETGAWWALDERRGIEQVLALVSSKRRHDMEQALAPLDHTPTQSNGFRSITKPIAAGSTRGIVTVRAARVTSRWFLHE